MGSTEQHGPSGLIGTDALTAENISWALGEAAGALVAPTISVGMAQHHMAFAGSMTMRPSTLVALVEDWVTSLGVHGFERFFFVNGHGGNVASMKAAFDQIYSSQSLHANKRNLRCRLVNWFEDKKVAELCRKEFGKADGQHATCGEISVTQHLFPDHIKEAALDPQVAPPARGFHDAADYRQRYPDGRMGSNPSLANPKMGKRIMAAAVAHLAAAYESLVDGE